MWKIVKSTYLRPQFYIQLVYRATLSIFWTKNIYYFKAKIDIFLIISINFLLLTLQTTETLILDKIYQWNIKLGVGLKCLYPRTLQPILPLST